MLHKYHTTKFSTEMTIHICKNLISHTLKNPSHLHKLYFPFSFSLLFFSSSTQKQPKTTTPLPHRLLNKHQFPPETTSKLSTILTHLKTPEKFESTLSFLKDSGFSNTHLENLIKRAPTVLSSNPDHIIKPKIKIFQDLGFSPKDIADIISADPWVLTRSLDNQLVPSLMVLRNVLGSSLGVSKILKKSGRFLKTDLEKCMLPNIEFMKSVGICSSQIMRGVYSFPRLFLYKPLRIREFVKRVDEMGFNRYSNMFFHAIRVLSSMTVENWEHKLELFRSLGFSEVDIVSVFRTKPQVFAVSERKIKEVTQILLDTGEVDMSFIVNHPDSLICSVEKRLKPRLRVVEILENKKLLRKKPSMTTIYKSSDKMFFDKFVFPYSNEIGEICMAAEH